MRRLPSGKFTILNLYTSPLPRPAPAPRCANALYHLKIKPTSVADASSSLLLSLFLSSTLLLHVLPAFRAGLDAYIPSLRLEHIPELSASDEPLRVVERYLLRGGFTALLR